MSPRLILVVGVASLPMMAQTAAATKPPTLPSRSTTTLPQLSRKLAAQRSNVPPAIRARASTEHPSR